MIHEYQTTLPGADVLRRAKKFFADNIPLSAAYPEREGPAFLVLRGQGGEEIVLSVSDGPEGSRIRASTLLFDQAIGRFFSTLPASVEVVS
jgi:hypothetical protein